MNHIKISSETDEVIKTLTCSYQYSPLIKIDTLKCHACHQCFKECPRGVFTDANFCYSKNEKEIVFIDTKNCSMCMKCISCCETNAINVEEEGGKFIFAIETINAPKPEEVLKKSHEILLKESKS